MASKIIIALAVIFGIGGCADPNATKDITKKCVQTDTLLNTQWESLEPLSEEKKLVFQSQNELITSIIQTREFDTLFLKEVKQGDDTCMKMYGIRITNRCEFEDANGNFQYTFERTPEESFLLFEHFNGSEIDSLIFKINLNTKSTVTNYYKWDHHGTERARGVVYWFDRDSMEIGGRTYYDVINLFNHEYHTSRYPKRTVIGLVLDKTYGVIQFRTNDTEWWDLMP